MDEEMVIKLASACEHAISQPENEARQKHNEPGNQTRGGIVPWKATETKRADQRLSVWSRKLLI